MEDKEIFGTRCWNFIGGDRQIERILRDLPHNQGLVVRNRLAHVLPTVAALADLGSEVALRVRVPENALVERAVPLDDAVAEGAFYPELLARVYGIRLETPAAAPGARDLLVAVGFTRDDEARSLADWLGTHPGLAVVFLVPAGETLAPVLRPFAIAAWSAQHWAGLNAFSMATVEEAVAEADPERIWVAGPSPAAVAYTAIGAADWFIREAAALGEPDDRAIRAIGARVGVLRLDPEEPAGPPRPFRELALAHMRDVLGVTDTAADPRARVTAEAIAIDIV